MASQPTSRRARAPKAAAPKKFTADPKLPFKERGGQLITVNEVANELGVTRRMALRLVGDGDIKKTKIGKLVRVHIDDLNAYIARQRGEA
jgi:excisionase family DNA binding protein